MAEREDLEDLLATVRERVEQRRRAGAYPPGLEEELDQHFLRLVGDRVASTAQILEELDAARAELGRFSYAPFDIPVESRIPGGASAHRMIAKAVARPIQGVVDQTQQHARLVDRTVALTADVVAALSDAYEKQVLQKLDDLQVLLAEQQRTLHRIALRLDDLAARNASPLDEHDG